MCRCRFLFNLANLVSAATLDGGIGLLLPMQEKTYRRLLMLQNALNTMLPHHAGLNPKAFRLVCFAQLGLRVQIDFFESWIQNYIEVSILTMY